MAEATLAETPLFSLHHALGGKMVGFAGYALPVQYGAGVLREHRQCRASAALFDVSHMGQIALPWSAAAALERLLPSDILGLAPGRQRYCLFTDADGGILDDLMVGRLEDQLLLVVNAAQKHADLAHLQAGLGQEATLSARALIALQGPMAEAVLGRLAPAIAPDIAAMRFMDLRRLQLAGADCVVARSGYTGEDGFEISVSKDAAETLAQRLLEAPELEPAGLGARDSLRLEAGLCLYGADIDRTTSPVEAGLAWSIPKIRRAGGARAGGFPGAGRILAELADGPARRRVGLRPEDRAPIRAGAPLFAAESDETPIGQVTSGGFGPSLEAPISIGYVSARQAKPATRLFAALRGRRVPVTVSKLPFQPPGYKRT